MTVKSPDTAPESESPADTTTHTDIVIVGAGLSGIGMAAHLLDECPGARYEILESRDDLGGTWDLFRYPGIRSDSDMYTMGYRFKPWNRPETVAPGQMILDYLREAAVERGIDKHIRFRHEVTRCSWNSDDSLWTITADTPDGQRQWTASYVVLATGYYGYDKAYTPDFAGMADFQGKIIHPQYWPQDYDYSDQRMVVIGSGATAVTLVPSLAETAKHVTMLQRSPTYMFTSPTKDPVSLWLRDRIPDSWIFQLARIRHIGFQMFSYQLSRRRPEKAADYLVREVAEQLPNDADVSDFTPTYRPWDQRLCLIPDGDLFAAMQQEKADVVTGQIKRFTKTGVELIDGRLLEADAIVTATGFDLLILGGAEIVVDGKALDLRDTKVYKGMMFSGVPNLAFMVGYTNASWTLKVDMVASHFCRLLNYMKRKGYDVCTPEATDPELQSVSMMPLTSGYIQRSQHLLPEEGHRAPWRLRQNYFLDYLALTLGRVRHKELKFRRRSAQKPPDSARHKRRM